MKHQLLFLILMAFSSHILPRYGYHHGGPSFGFSIGGPGYYGYYGPGYGYYGPGYYGYRRGPFDFVGDTIAGIATAEAIKEASRNSSRDPAATDNKARRSEVRRQIYNAQDDLDELKKILKDLHEKYGEDSNIVKEHSKKINEHELFIKRLETELRRI